MISLRSSIVCIINNTRGCCGKVEEERRRGVEDGKGREGAPMRGGARVRKGWL